MKRYLFAIALPLLSARVARADSASGLVSQLSILSGATGNQGKLRLKMRTENGERRTLCMNGTTRIYEAYVPANATSTISLIQALLTAAMIGQETLKVESTFNGSQCIISSVTYGE